MSDADRLMQVLALERACLRTGDIAALAVHAVAKERLVGALGAGTAAAPLSRIARELERNGALLAAAGEGMRRAIQRTADLAQARRGLRVYEAGGRAHLIPLSAPADGRRA